jgi:hypothetical protein
MALVGEGSNLLLVTIKGCLSWLRDIKGEFGNARTTCLPKYDFDRAINYVETKVAVTDYSAQFIPNADQLPIDAYVIIDDGKLPDNFSWAGEVQLLRNSFHSVIKKRKR